MAPQPATPLNPTSSSSGAAQPQNLVPATLNVSNSSTLTPGSASSNNTFLMPASPVKGRRGSTDGYKPKISRTHGQRPACLVNASVTYCGNDQIYAFGGFDQYTDEVYNHVLRLDLRSLQWTLVDNYGDIPGVRMGHTATLYQGDKLLVFGGENEHRTYLSDILMFDLKTAHWTQPTVGGLIPKGRARHAAVLHDDKLFIVGGVSGHNNYVLDDICFLDLVTWTWSRSWRFVGRFDHTAWVWGGRLWVFGGLGEDMERNQEMWWLDLKGNPVFDGPPTFGQDNRMSGSGRVGYGSRFGLNQNTLPTGSSGYAANSSSIQSSLPSSSKHHAPPVAPGAISMLRFTSGTDVPPQMSGSHFHVYSSGSLLDFVTPAPTIRPGECNISALDLDNLRWQKLAEGADVFNPGYYWHYCVLNEDGTKAWLLGCSIETTTNDGLTNVEEYLSDVLPIDLKKFGLLGNSMTSAGLAQRYQDPTLLDRSSSDRGSSQSSLGTDLASMFDKSSDSGSGADFIITAEPDEPDAFLAHEDADSSSGQQQPWASASTSPPIHVHKLILQARWPHFARLYAAQMAEFHTKKMHIPEPYACVRAFLYYLYTDNISPSPYCPDLGTVAGLLVMANVYDLPRLRLLAVNRLARELDVENAAIIWERAGTAGEDWLRKKAACFCLCYWGRVVRTQGFRRLARQSLMELCEEIDTEGRVVGGDELEAIGGLAGGRLGSGLMGGVQGAGGGWGGREGRSTTSSAGIHLGEEMEDGDGEEDEGMEMS